MIPVTKPFLPPKEEYDALLTEVWDRNWLTNNGPMVNELERRLKSYLDVDHLLFVTNGTIALQLAIKALEVEGEVITTPFSYVATTSSIVWEHCNPVFVDIEEDTWNINPQLIEEAITERTTAILATHVFGTTCNVEVIARIAEQHNLKVIYDGAHGFGSTYKNNSLLSYGDICATSFHATKIYHSVEGGAVIAKDPELIERMSFMRNFGHNGPGIFEGVGINGKNSEFHAAMGLVNLKYFEQVLAKRKRDTNYYNQKLQSLKFTYQADVVHSDNNCSYYPILMPTEEALLKTVAVLNNNEIYPRRYFYPGLHELSYVNSKDLPITEGISRRILCLPLYYDLATEEIDVICQHLLTTCQ